MNIVGFIKKIYGHSDPYKGYLDTNYEKLSENDMMDALNGVFDIDPSTKKGLFDQTKHYKVVEKIVIASFKLKYQSVCNELKKIYPLTYPMWQENVLNDKSPFDYGHLKNNSSTEMPEPVELEEEDVEESEKFKAQEEKLKEIDTTYVQKKIKDKLDKLYNNISFKDNIMCGSDENECDLCNHPQGYMYLITILSKNKMKDKGGIEWRYCTSEGWYAHLSICQKCALGNK